MVKVIPKERTSASDRGRASDHGTADTCPTRLRRRAVEIQHQSQLTPVSTQKGSEYATGEVSEKSVAFSLAHADSDGAC